MPKKGRVREDATPLWVGWQFLFSALAPVFTRPGWGRFVPWVPGMRRCWEEHTSTPILTALGLESCWRVVEHCAASGAWDREAGARQPRRLIARERPARGVGDPPVAIDATKRHRTSRHVWGTWTCHASSARSPNRAATVRAHNWVVMGALRPGRPWAYLPHAARVDCRKSQVPAGEDLRTNTAVAVDVVRQAAAESAAPILAIFDGAYATDTVGTPWLQADPGQRRLACGTRLRADARWSHPVVAKPRAKGRRPGWGRGLAAPPPHLYWPTLWQRSRAWGYGRQRPLPSKQLRCHGAVRGPHIPRPALVIAMDGYPAPCFLVTSALKVSAAQVVEACTARFRQEDAFRDHPPRVGMEACQAWTQEPVLRTLQVQWVALTRLRLLQDRLDHAWGQESWGRQPAWHPRTRHGALLDLRRLCWRHRPVCSPFLVTLEDIAQLPQGPASGENPVSRVA
jgi:hypothetical protein